MPTPTSPRIWGRTNSGVPPYQWVAVTPDANGSMSAFNLAWLIQVLKLNLLESPTYSDWGIPAVPDVQQQLQPDYYVNLTQQRFSQYFASLRINKISSNAPTYNLNVITLEGTALNFQVLR